MRRHGSHSVTDVTESPSSAGGRKREPHLKLVDVLNELGLSRAAFYRMRARGNAPKCIKLPNGQLRFRRQDFDAWLSTYEEDLTC